MKIPLYITLLLAGTTATALGVSSAVNVKFHESESFTDFKMQPNESTADRIALERELRARIEEIAGTEVPPDYHLDLQINDVDLAGNFEPEQGSNVDNIRIVRDVYPPKINLEYTLKGPTGEPVASGERTLTDSAFQETLKTTSNDRLFHEAQLIKNFISEISQRR